MSFFTRAKPTDADRVSQARVDAIVAGARAQTPVAPKRPLFREPMRAPLAPSTELLDLRIEEELAYARRTLEAMGEALCEDPILLARHGTKLQTIDLLAQILGHLASVVGAADRDDAIGRIGMIELRSRLTRANCNVTDAAPTFNRSSANPLGGS